MTAPPVQREPVVPPDAVIQAPAARRVTLRHRIEYGALRLVTALLSRLSFRRASDLGAALGRLGYRPFGIRRRVVERQIAAAFPEWTEDRVRATARAAYENLGRTTIEAAILAHYDDVAIRALVEPRHWNLIQDRTDQGRGVIVLSGHIGNWELGGAYLGARGVKGEAVVRQMENPLFDAYLSRTRRRLGFEIIRDFDAVRRIPRVLRAGGVVVILFDQGAVGLASTWVPFFGRYAKTPRGPAVFARRYGVPIVCGAVLRKPDGTFTLDFEEIPLRDTGDLEADIDGIVADYTAALERAVRRAPEQYFWHHRRWKHQRPDTPPHLGDPL
jgi:Kdo2-lipid IVA lauroyltransferase/acyltransferase